MSAPGRPQMGRVSLCFALAASALADESGATMTLCNKTGVQVSAALASGENATRGPVRVRGWWTLAPNQCTVVSQNDSTRYWTVFHAHGKGVRFDGPQKHCVRDLAFDRSVDPDHARECPPDHRLQGFQFIPAKSANWTHNLQPDTSSSY